MTKITHLLILGLLIMSTSCSSTPFKPFRGVAEVCHDSKARTGCLKTIDTYDNTTLHKHDYRELRDIEVPVK